MIYRVPTRPDAPRTLRVRVPAKINLSLAVGPLRDDGFHEVNTVLHAVSLYDEVEASDNQGLSLTIEGEGAATLPTDEDNLAVRAALALAGRAGVDPDVALHIRKGIPIAGGMAGGSADAAAALVACDALWGTGLSRAELGKIAAGLGSDVPFSLAGGTALGHGRGELLNPVLAPHRRHWVIAIAEDGLSTPDVYRELDRLRDNGSPLPIADSERVIAALSDLDSEHLAGVLRNDLQAATLSLRPNLRRTLHAGVDEGALAGLVSGSGPSCFFLAEDADHAVEIAAALAGRGVCRTVRTAHGPVPGARIVEDR